MGRRLVRLIGLVILTAAMSACNFPRYEPSVQPLEVPTFGPPPTLGPVGSATWGVPGVTSRPGTPVAFETPAFEPETMLLCITDDGVRLRAGPSTADFELAMFNARTTVTRLNGEALQADGHTWYNVQIGDQTGWMASDWLRPGDCNTAVSGGETPTIIDVPRQSGYGWGDVGSMGENHNGLDLASNTGDTTIAAPYEGNIIAADACAACTRQDPAEGNTQGQANADNNYGYGATVVVEVAYEDLSEAELSELAEDGIAIGPGESLYMLYAHLDPTSVPNAGADLGAEDAIATIGNSGNSSGDHVHVEVAVNDSGLAPTEDDNIALFWGDTVAERDRPGDPGLRIDPSPLFDLD